MAVRRRGRAVLRQIGTLFNVGMIGDLADGQLLERFATDPDEAAELAFSALVERHGPMVWRVCLAILRDEHDAEDAFQATFLVLVRKARSLWVRDSLGPWLHQVTCRTASCLRAALVRRRRHERRRAERDAAHFVDLATPRDVGRDAAVHQEIDRLPEKYRLPIVLCDLEGRTHQEAARSLGWPIGTVKSRQAQGRARLRDRLSRRGLGLAVAGAVVESSTTAGTAAIPEELSRIAVGAAMRQAGRLAAGAAISTSVLTLTRGVIRAQLWARIRWLAIVTLAIGIASGGAIASMRGPRGQAAKDDRPAADQRVPADDVPLRLTLDEAVKAARAIEDPAARRLALVRIANVQAALNDLPSARATARLAQQSAEQIGSESDRHYRLGLVAKLQARLGDVESARRVFERLVREDDAKPPRERISLLGQIAMAQEEGGLHADAVTTLNRAAEVAGAIVASTRDAGVYFDVVFAQCQVGDFDGVLRIAEGIQGEKDMYSDVYLQYLARDCDKAGPAEARRILTKALELSKKIDRIYPRGGTQKMIAQAMARNGDIPGALAASKLIGQVQEVPEKKGLFSFLDPRQQRERELRRRMDEDIAQGLRREVADVLAVVAARQAGSGDRAAAKKTFREAMEMMLADPDELRKNTRLAGLVEHLAGAGELEAAGVAIEAIRGDEGDRAHALVAMAKGQARSGDKAGARANLVAAFEAARQIKARPRVINDLVDARKDQAFREIESAQVELGAFPDALATVTVHGHQGLKGDIQAGYAGFQARQGDLAAALKTADSIPDAGYKAEAFRNIARGQSWTGRRGAAHDWAAGLGSPQERALGLLGVVEGALERRKGE